jgi:hypothetical protein
MKLGEVTTPSNSSVGSRIPAPSLFIDPKLHAGSSLSRDADHSLAPRGREGCWLAAARHRNSWFGATSCLCFTRRRFTWSDRALVVSLSIAAKDAGRSGGSRNAERPGSYSCSVCSPSPGAGTSWLRGLLTIGGVDPGKLRPRFVSEGSRPALGPRDYRWNLLGAHGPKGELMTQDWGVLAPLSNLQAEDKRSVRAGLQVDVNVRPLPFRVPRLHLHTARRPRLPP